MMKTISVNDAYQLAWAGKALLIDVREADEFAAEHIGYALSLPLSSIEENFSQLNIAEDATLIMQCRSGARSQKAAAYIQAIKPQAIIYNLEGGIMEWVGAGLPTIR